MTREMRAPDGAFYSSLDADSEGEEGQVLRLDARRGARAARAGRVRGRRAALRARRPAEFRGPRVEPARRARRSPTSRRALGDSAARGAARGSTRAKAALFAARARRVRPGLDDKILTSWNALAIAGLARAARALDEPRLGRSRARRGRRAARAPRGATAGCSRRARASARISTPISTTTRSCSRRCSSSCRRGFAARTTRGRASSPTCCSTSSRTARTAASSSRATTTSGSSTGRSPATTTRRRRATASPRGRSIALGHLCGRAALRRRGRARGAAVRACVRDSPAGAATLLAALEDTLIRRRRCCSPAMPRTCGGWQRALERSLRPAVRIFNVAGIALPAELAKGPPPARAPSGGSAGGRSACRRCAACRTIERDAGTPTLRRQRSRAPRAVSGGPATGGSGTIAAVQSPSPTESR